MRLVSISVQKILIRSALIRALGLHFISGPMHSLSFNHPIIRAVDTRVNDCRSVNYRLLMSEANNQLVPQPLPSRNFPNNYSLVALVFDSTQSDLQAP